MIRSMTGFGHAAFEVDGLAFEIEIRSVNHRYLDVRARLPKALASDERAIKVRVQEALQRGRVDVAVSGATSGPSPSRCCEGDAGTWERTASLPALARGQDLRREQAHTSRRSLGRHAAVVSDHGQCEVADQLSPRP